MVSGDVKVTSKTSYLVDKLRNTDRIALHCLMLYCYLRSKKEREQRDLFGKDDQLSNSRTKDPRDYRHQQYSFVDDAHMLAEFKLALQDYGNAIPKRGAILNFTEAA